MQEDNTEKQDGSDNTWAQEADHASKNTDDIKRFPNLNLFAKESTKRVWENILVSAKVLAVCLLLPSTEEFNIKNKFIKAVLPSSANTVSVDRGLDAAVGVDASSVGGVSFSPATTWDGKAQSVPETLPQSIQLEPPSFAKSKI